MSFKSEFLAALTKVFVQGIMDWKMPLFRGFIYAMIPGASAVYSGLQDYNSLADLDGLVWFKLSLSFIIGSGTALGAFLDSSFTRTKDRLQEAADAATTKP